MNEAFAAFTAFLIAALPLSVGVTKIVDTVRNLFGTAETKVPKVVWNILALVVGVAVALGFELNLFEALAAAIPALKPDIAAGTAGEVLTGLAIGGMAGFWHEKMDAWSSEAKALKTEGASSG
jgi:RsiW-degrading membrane proteinase PrsW (M82 family)